MCKPSGFLSLDPLRARDFSINALNESWDGSGRMVVRTVVCGTAVIGLPILELPGSYLAEVSRSGGASVATAVLSSSLGALLCLLFSFSFSRSDPELSGVGSWLGRGKGGSVTSTGVSPMEGNRFLKYPPGVTMPRARLLVFRRNPPGVPPGEIADSAIGVTPGPFVGVRSVDARPGNLNLPCAGASKEVMTLSEAFFAVILCIGGAESGGDTGGLSMEEMLDGA